MKLYECKCNLTIELEWCDEMRRSVIETELLDALIEVIEKWNALAGGDLTLVEINET